MSEFNFTNFIGNDKTITETVSIIPPPDLAATNLQNNRVFDLDLFIQETYDSNTSRNKVAIQKQNYMSSYDIASGCIGNIVYKIRNTPIKNYASKWLPIVLRSYLGNAVHSFIQDNSKQFTEQEVSLKVPSIKVSGRLDCLINNDTLVEIKSLPYSDYRKIIKNKAPRQNDFYQTLLYKYLLENHLNELKTHTEETRTQKPMLDSYNIRYIQFLYVVHDIMAADIESLDEAVECVKHVKKVLNSSSNTFYFVSNLLIDLENYDLTPYMLFITDKIQKVNHYLDNNLEVSEEDIDTKACFFCLHSEICPRGLPRRR